MSPAYYSYRDVCKCLYRLFEIRLITYLSTTLLLVGLWKLPFYEKTKNWIRNVMKCGKLLRYNWMTSAFKNVNTSKLTLLLLICISVSKWILLGSINNYIVQVGHPLRLVLEKAVCILLIPGTFRKWTRQNHTSFCPIPPAGGADNPLIDFNPL